MQTPWRVFYVFAQPVSIACCLQNAVAYIAIYALCDATLSTDVCAVLSHFTTYSKLVYSDIRGAHTDFVNLRIQIAILHYSI